MVNGDLRGVSQASVSRVVKRVSIQLAEQLERFVHFPENEDAQRRTILQFFGQHNFPSVIGCVDGTHIPICSPGGDHAETFRNRKGFFPSMFKWLLVRISKSWILLCDILALLTTA